MDIWRPASPAGTRSWSRARRRGLGLATDSRAADTIFGQVQDVSAALRATRDFLLREQADLQAVDRLFDALGPASAPAASLAAATLRVRIGGARFCWWQRVEDLRAGLRVVEQMPRSPGDTLRRIEIGAGMSREQYGGADGAERLAAFLDAIGPALDALGHAQAGATDETDGPSRLLTEVWIVARSFQRTQWRSRAELDTRVAAFLERLAPTGHAARDALASALKQAWSINASRAAASQLAAARDELGKSCRRGDALLRGSQGRLTKKAEELLAHP
jgi:hypothetical protein